ncbi:MAG: tetratricopeptide repeat protein [Pseudomonadota bacterium]
MGLLDSLTSEQLTAVGAIAAVVAVIVTLLLAVFTPLRRWLWERLRPAKRPQERTVPFRGVKGREDDLRKIRDALIEDGTGVLVPGADVVAVSGGGGVGKTTLAKHYADEHRKDYDHVHIIRCEREAEMHEDLARLVKGQGRAADLAAEALIRIRESKDRWLLIYDNAPDLDAIESMLPEGAYVHVLVTSRNRDWTRNKLRRLDLDVLSPAATVAVLEAEAGFVDDDAGALAERLGFLPLALVQAGALVKERGGGLAPYIADLDKVLQTAPLAKDYPRSVDATVALSLRGLGLDETALLNLFAWIAPEGLTADLLAPVADLPEEDEWLPDIPEPLIALANNLPAAEAALARLQRRSLLTPSAEEQGFALHRLTALVLRTRQNDDAFARAAAAVLAAGYPYYSNEFQNWPLCARLTPHVLALHDTTQQTDPQNNAMGRLCNQTSVYLREQTVLPAALRLAETSLTLKQKHYGPDHQTTGVGHSQIGIVCTDLRNLPAAEMHLRRALEISTTDSHATADNLAITLNNLAGVFGGQAEEERKRGESGAAKAQEAQVHYRTALTLTRSALRRASTDGDALTAREAAVLETTELSGLATLNDTTGRRCRARVLAKAAIDRWQAAGLPPDDPRHAFNLNTLGALHQRLGEPAAARAPLERALHIFETQLPPGHPNTRNTALWLAACLFALDPPRVEAAEALCKDHRLDQAKHRADAARFMAEASRRPSA